MAFAIPAVAALAGGAAAYSMSDSGDSDPQPDWLGQSQGGTSIGPSVDSWLRDYMGVVTDPAINQQLLESEQAYRPRWTDLGLADVQRTMLGSEGQMGTIDLLGQTTPQIGQIQADALAQQREADISDVEALGGRATEALRSADPEMQGLLDAQKGQMYGAMWRDPATTQAQQAGIGDLQTQLGGVSGAIGDVQSALGGVQGDITARRDQILGAADMSGERARMSQLEQGAYDRQAPMLQRAADITQRASEFDQGLSAQQERQAAQQAREAAGARGIGMGNAAIASEILNRENFLAGNRAEARTMRGEAQGLRGEALGMDALASGLRGEGMGLREEESRRRGEALGLDIFGQGLRGEQAGLRGELGGIRGEQAGLRGELGGLRREEEAYRAQQFGEGQQGAMNMFNMLGSTAADPFQAILGRPGMAFGGAQQQQGFGAGMAGQMMGPQLYDPNAGINIGLQQQGNALNYQSAMAGADAAKDAGMYSGLGSLAGAAIGAYFMCWVAREVYGTEDDRWMLFREWMFHAAPKWFFNLYAKHGESFAKWVSNKPLIKTMIRKWMDGRIATLERGFSYGI